MERPGRRWLWWAVALSGVVVAACGSDDKPTSGITIETLAAATGTACPVAFEVSADNSGIDTPSPATGSVVVGHPRHHRRGRVVAVAVADRRRRRRHRDLLVARSPTVRSS